MNQNVPKTPLAGGEGGPGRPRPLLEVVSAHWAATPYTGARLITQASLGLVAVGCVLVAAGVLGDERGWWESRPFLTNVISTVAGACFGLPLALLVFRRASELRGAQAAAQRDAADSAELCERMHISARRIEQYWANVGWTSKQNAAGDEWASVIDEVTTLVVMLRAGGSDRGSYADAVRPLTLRYRKIGLGTVQVAAVEILNDWRRLQTLAGSSTYLRAWEDEWTGPRSIDVRPFSDILAGLDQADRLRWCDYFARLPDHLSDDDGAVVHPDLERNAWDALRFLRDVETVLARLHGTEALPRPWRNVQATYDELLAAQYQRVGVGCDLQVVWMSGSADTEPAVEVRSGLAERGHGTWYFR